MKDNKNRITEYRNKKRCQIVRTSILKMFIGLTCVTGVVGFVLTLSYRFIQYFGDKPFNNYKEFLSLLIEIFCVIMVHNN